MPLKFRMGNIIDSRFHVTAVVNSANPNPDVIGDNGVDEAVYRAAGIEELHKERAAIGEIHSGQAFLTSACNMHNINGARYIIHTVVTPWVEKQNREEDVLRSCYIESLKLINGKNIKTAAFPLLGSGAYGFPADKAFKIAVEVITRWLERNYNDCDIWLVTNTPEANELAINYGKSNPEVFLDNNYVENDMHAYVMKNYDRSLEYFYHEHDQIESLKKAFKKSQRDVQLEAEEFLKANSTDLDLASTLQFLMNKKNITSSDFFKAKIFDSSYYGKIINRTNKSVKKETVMAMGFVMKLSMDDFEKLLASGGYALNRSSKTDLLAIYCIQNQIYDLKKKVPDIYLKCNVDSFF